MGAEGQGPGIGVEGRGPGIGAEGRGSRNTNTYLLISSKRKKSNRGTKHICRKIKPIALII